MPNEERVREIAKMLWDTFSGRYGGPYEQQPENGIARKQCDDLARAIAALPVQVSGVEDLPNWPKNLHPDTTELLGKFIVALAKKMRLAEKKYGYYNLWIGDGWEAECRNHLYQHLEKGDPRDVAAYCAFMWFHQWTTYRPASPRSQVLTEEERERWQLDPDHPWRLHLYERLYNAAVHVTGDQIEARKIANAGIAEAAIIDRITNKDAEHG